jgi:hypothetical protein
VHGLSAGRWGSFTEICRVDRRGRISVDLRGRSEDHAANRDLQGLQGWARKGQRPLRDGQSWIPRRGHDGSEWGGSGDDRFDVNPRVQYRCIGRERRRPAMMSNYGKSSGHSGGQENQPILPLFAVAFPGHLERQPCTLRRNCWRAARKAA